MLDTENLNDGIVTYLSTKLAYKRAKTTGENSQWVQIRLKDQFAKGIKMSQHFQERVLQRFTEDDAKNLIGAVSRAIKNTKPLEFARSEHLGVAQKFVDEATNIVVVLERMGEFGAHLVTTYVLGKEYQLSTEEVQDLNKRGLVC